MKDIIEEGRAGKHLSSRQSTRAPFAGRLLTRVLAARKRFHNGAFCTTISDSLILNTCGRRWQHRRGRWQHRGRRWQHRAGNTLLLPFPQHPQLAQRNFEASKLAPLPVLTWVVKHPIWYRYFCHSTFQQPIWHHVFRKAASKQPIWRHYFLKHHFDASNWVPLLVEHSFEFGGITTKLVLLLFQDKFEASNLVPLLLPHHFPEKKMVQYGFLRSTTLKHPLWRFYFLNTTHRAREAVSSWQKG